MSIPLYLKRKLGFKHAGSITPLSNTTFIFSPSTMNVFPTIPTNISFNDFSADTVNVYTSSNSLFETFPFDSEY